MEKNPAALLASHHRSFGGKVLQFSLLEKTFEHFMVDFVKKWTFFILAHCFIFKIFSVPFGKFGC